MSNPQTVSLGELLKESSELAYLKAVIPWAMEQAQLGRKLVALVPPTEAHDGLRYAGYYCVDGPDPPERT